MPKVGKKHYPYTQKGVAAARQEAKRTGGAVTGKNRKNRKKH